MEKPELFQRPYIDGNVDHRFRRPLPTFTCFDLPREPRGVFHDGDGETSDPDDLRALSTWLLKAADWLEEKEEEG